METKKEGCIICKKPMMLDCMHYCQAWAFRLKHRCPYIDDIKNTIAELNPAIGGERGNV